LVAVSVVNIINHFSTIIGMAINRKMIDADRLTKLLRDPMVIKIVTVLDVVSLSILELLEYGITRKNIS
jgi:hypothetical protein